MRKIVVDVTKRKAPVVKTPAKGSVGDRTDETQAKFCDIGTIIQRYGGNLAELAAWRGSMSYGDQPVDNLEDALEIINNAEDVIANMEGKPFADFADAINSIRDGSFYTKMNNTQLSKEVEINNNEKTENIKEAVKENISKDSK